MCADESDILRGVGEQAVLPHFLVASCRLDVAAIDFLLRTVAIGFGWGRTFSLRLFRSRSEVHRADETWGGLHVGWVRGSRT